MLGVFKTVAQSLNVATIHSRRLSKQISRRRQHTAHVWLTSLCLNSVAKWLTLSLLTTAKSLHAGGQPPGRSEQGKCKDSTFLPEEHSDCVEKATTCCWQGTRCGASPSRYPPNLSTPSGNRSDQPISPESITAKAGRPPQAGGISFAPAGSSTTVCRFAHQNNDQC